MSHAVRRRPDAVGRAVLAGIARPLGVLLVLPLVALAVTVVTHLPEVVHQLLASDALHALGSSIVVALSCVALHAVFGTLGALVLVRQRFLGRRLLDALVDLPLALSPVMTGLAFLLLFGRSGVLRPLTDAVGVQFAFAWPGVLLATLFGRCRSPCARSRSCSRRSGTPRSRPPPRSAPRRGPRSGG